MATQDELKRIAAEKAVEFVPENEYIGIGTGSTAAAFIEVLGERVREGLDIVGVPTSEATYTAATRAGIARFHAK